MRWDLALRVVGIGGVLAAYLIFLRFGESAELFVTVVLAIGTLVMPEFIDHLPIGPTK